MPATKPLRCWPIVFVLLLLTIISCAGRSQTNANQASTDQDNSNQASICHLSPQPTKTEKQSMDWIDAATPDGVKGVALVIHGLNLRPDKMGALISTLTHSGVTVLKLSLRGHGKNHAFYAHLSRNQSRMQAFKTVSHSIWLEEAHRAYRNAERVSRKKNVPLFLVAFSYGALLGTDLFTSHNDVHFNKMVLFAPAFSVTFAYGLKWLAPFPHLVIPSFSSVSYRANSGTPIAAYNALFRTIAHFKSHLGPKINVPTLIFMDPKDELVSYRGLRRLIKANNLTHWNLHPIKKDPAGPKTTLRHLIIDEPSLGSKAWKEVQHQMKKHLLPDNN